MRRSRRDFLIASLAVAGGVLVVELQGCGGGDPDAAQVRADLGGLLPEGAARVGKAFRKLEPELGAADAAAAALSEVLSQRSATLGDATSLGVALRAQAKADYLAGETREVKGWVLSLTELRLCALAS